MIKMFTAYTVEVDDVDFAVSEVLEQLDLDNNLRKNSIGILTCYADFLEGDVIRALCERLPFDVVGITTLGAATEKSADLLILTLCVLTSDEVNFSAVLSDSLAENHESGIQRAYDAAASALPESPALVLACAPMMAHVGGEKIASRVDLAAGGAPVFGTLCCDHNFDSHMAHVIYNGGHYRDRLALVLLSGPIKPRFFLGALPLNNVQKHQAVITESEGNILHKVNGVSVAEYLRQMGLAPNDVLESSKSMPIVVDYRDGTPPAIRGFYRFTPEGSAICGGEMPVNATFALSTMDSSDVLLSTRQLFDEIDKMENNNGMLLISCVVRSFVLDLDPLAEMELVNERVKERFPYQLCYSGGELCPVYSKEGEVSNRFHNFSFIACVF